MPKAKPVSLHPLSFEEAIAALIRIDAKHVESVKEKPKNKSHLKSAKP